MPYVCVSQERPESITFRHAMAEDTGLAGNSVDLVSACLIFHEIPSSGIKQILTEAWRILRPGGCLGIMVSAHAEKALLSCIKAHVLPDKPCIACM